MLKIDTDGGTDIPDGESESLSQNEQAIILELIKNPRITYSGIVNETGILRRTVSRVMTALVQRRHIERV